MNKTDWRRPVPRTGFTLLELLVVLGIILLLISILIPTVSKVKTHAQTAAVKAEISNIAGAIERFNQQEHQFPGPLPDDWLYTAGRSAGTKPPITLAAGATGTLDASHITQEENLLLGLLGGLEPGPVANQYVFDPSLIGHGGIKIGVSGQRMQPFMSDDPKIRSPYTGKAYTDETNISADDSSIPEFVDTYPNPMPILYLRAHIGATGVIRNNVPETAGNPRMQYDLSDIYPYTSKAIGVGKTISPKEYYKGGAQSSPPAGTLPHGLQTVNDDYGADTMQKGNGKYTYPFDAVPYLLNPSVPVPPTAKSANVGGTARAKDTYILISAGPDRVYGTRDDVCSFGSVTE